VKFFSTLITQKKMINTESNNKEYLYKDITDRIISCFYKVYNNLGFGFLEKIYERALLIELKKADLIAEDQKPVKVYYDEYKIGDFTADILVNEKVFVEIKASKALCEENELQLINYLKSTVIEVGLLLNFGLKPEIKRKIFTNDRKPQLAKSRLFPIIFYNKMNLFKKICENPVFLCYLCAII